jgi:hypothetical protein
VGRRPAATGCVLFMAGIQLLPAGAAAQQFVTDDAEIVDYRACQVEVWRGETASWLLPACQVIRNLEIAAGMGFVEGENGRSAEHVVEGRLSPRKIAPGVGMGFVAGVSFRSVAGLPSRGRGGIHAYIPVSMAIAEDRVHLHANAGWQAARDEPDEATHVVRHGATPDDARHEATWAARADVILPPARERFTLIGEVFGEGGGRPEYQVGLRSTVVPGRLVVDVSWGGHTAAGSRGLGWVLGAAWTPPPFF